MTFTSITTNHDESGDISESSPLLQNGPESDACTPIPAETQYTVSLKRKKYIILLLCVFAFTMMLGDNLQPAALIQVFEGVICDDYYKMHPSLSEALHTANDCKIQPVQKELALLRGFQQLVPLFPSLLCTMPYGLLAQRIGRKSVLILSGAGIVAALSWVLAVCYWRFVSIRWVLLSGVFLFIGGGDAVISSMVHVMVTDTTNQAERAQIFLYLHAADVISGFFGPAISAPLMEKGHPWAVLLLAEAVLFSGTFLLTRFIPETLNLRNKSGDNSNLIPDHTPSQVTASSPRLSASPSSTKINYNPLRASGLLVHYLSVLTSNRQALLLLGIFAPQTAARELFTVIGLQYSSSKFSLPYARGNVLLSLFQGAQGLFVLVLLPLITRAIAEPRGWTPWTRDRRYAIVSIAVTALGLMVIGLAPALAVEATGLLMSLLGEAVLPSQVSTFYSAALTLSMMMRSLTGPIVSALLVKGLDLGWKWMGLPFGAMAMLMVGVAVASGFIRRERMKNDGEE